jgi:hypothetical protein
MNTVPQYHQEKNYNEASPNAGENILESGALGESAFYELNTIWH